MSSISTNPDNAWAAMHRAAQLLPRQPAVKALLVQVISTLLVAVVMTFWAVHSLPSMPVIAWVSIQALLAALIAWGFVMEPWWLLMHLAFMPALFTMSYLNIPSWAFLAGFILLFSVHGATYRTRVPLHLTRREVIDLLVQQMPASKKFNCIDLGCGTGGVLSAMAKRRQSGTYAGVEAAILPWLVSWVRGRMSGFTVIRGKIAETDIRGYDIVYAYLSPAAMPGLWQKACSEMRSGSLLISNSFEIPGVVPTRTLCASNGMKLHLWRIQK